MKQKIEIQKNILNNLTTDEMQLLINITSKEDLIDLIKKNQKKFKTEIAGFRIDSKHFPVNILHNIYLNRFKKGDFIITKKLDSLANTMVNITNDSIIKETSNEDYFYEAVKSSDVTIFANLIEKILIELKPENIKLLFKLMGHELTPMQKDYIDKDMQLILVKQDLSVTIKKDFEEKVIKLNSNHKTEIYILDDKIKDLENQLELSNKGIIQERKRSSDSAYKFNYIEEIANIKEKNLINNISQLNKKIKGLMVEILNQVNTIDEKDIQINKMNERLNLEFKEQSVIFKKQWEIENKVLLGKNRELDNDCIRLHKEEKRLNDDIDLLVEKVKYYDLTVEKYIQNIDKNVIINALNSSLLKSGAKTNDQETINRDSTSRPYTKTNEKSEKLSGCQDINTFSENIANNLEKLGVGNVSDEIANYIIGIFASGLTPLICGYKSREVATAISTAYSGETPYIITLPNGYTNARELTDIYCESSASSILIEDALGTMNENAILPLLRDKSQNDLLKKILILSAENSDSVKYMPKSFFNYIALVSIDKFSATKKIEYIYSNAKDVLEKFIDNEDLDVELKKIKKLLKNLKLGNSYKNLRTSIVAYSHRLSNIKDAIQGYARCELKMVCEYNDLYDKIEKNINLNTEEFDNSLLEIIKGDFDE
ncbi:hypothetical protein LL033_01160 [Clostridium estertheticum]|uniref:hypothetical protein n=1 Tax=Clostridium estertheticum TaxID=238834 RepID=UPI001C0B4B6A|nr:hypothetical protein [Clostridium estertheticum]MBU3218187.1 hypothetical protein [Clostridium estertheticum]WAG55876.1 hypothetical protein LL033_01160 [Clostridium estertheticum]